MDTLSQNLRHYTIQLDQKTMNMFGVATNTLKLISESMNL